MISKLIQISRTDVKKYDKCVSKMLKNFAASNITVIELYIIKLCLWNRLENN